MRSHRFFDSRTTFLLVFAAVLCGASRFCHGQPGGYGAEGMYGGGGMLGGGGYGGAGGMTLLPTLKFVLSHGEDGDDKTQLTPQSATRVVGFLYTPRSLKPSEFPEDYVGRYGDYGGMSMGGAADMGGPGTGHDPGSFMGGPGMGADGSMGTGGNPYGSAGPIEIFAYIFDTEKQANGRTRIEVVTRPRTSPAAANPGGLGMGSEYGGGPGGYGESGVYAGGEGYGGDSGMGSPAPPPTFVRLSSLCATSEKQAKPWQLLESEYEIVADTIRQSIWKRDAIKLLNVRKQDAQVSAKTEHLLKEILTEEFETQLARQRIEVERIEQRVQQLRDELARREAAKERVIDVQLGRIVLEAQGLLGR